MKTRSASISRCAVFAMLLAVCIEPAHASQLATPLGSWSEGLQAPSDVTADIAGNLYVVESGAGRIISVDAFGRSQVVCTGLAHPLAIALDAAGNFNVSQRTSGSVTVFNPQWQVSGTLGAGAGEFKLPNALAADAFGGTNTLYVCDGAANEIKAYRNGALWQRFGSKGTGNGQFKFPAGIWVSAAGEVFVVDQGNGRVQVFSRSGTFLRTFALGAGGVFNPPLSRSLGITGDRSGRLYVAEAFQGYVQVFAINGTLLNTLGDFGEATGKFRTPARLVVDSLNRLCVASVNNARLELLGLPESLHVSITPLSQCVAAGTDVTLSAAVTGRSAVSFQWQRNGLNIPGATGATLDLNAITAAQSGSYAVVVSGASGAQTSPTVLVQVLAAPQITTQPASQSVFQGANVALAVAATGDALNYQWQRNGADIPDATNAALPFSDAQPEVSGDYAVAVKNAVGAALSDTATLTVRPTPLQPQIDNLALDLNSNITMQVNGEAGYIFSLESSTNLYDWFGLMQLTNDTGSIDLLFPPDNATPSLFYRLKWSP